MFGQRLSSIGTLALVALCCMLTASIVSERRQEKEFAMAIQAERAQLIAAQSFLDSLQRLTRDRRVRAFMRLAPFAQAVAAQLSPPDPVHALRAPFAPIPLAFTRAETTPCTNPFRSP